MYVSSMLVCVCVHKFYIHSVGFRTTPMDSTGVSHILEHTVLTGSRRYPCRDPFFKMLNRSLNTFMNALTCKNVVHVRTVMLHRCTYINRLCICVFSLCDFITSSEVRASLCMQYTYVYCSCLSVVSIPACYTTNYCSYYLLLLCYAVLFRFVYVYLFTYLFSYLFDNALPTIDPDYTLYPFSTQNSQDFKNLLSVYTDAVFFPRLREMDFRYVCM